MLRRAASTCCSSRSTALVPCLIVGGGHVATAIAPLLARSASRSRSSTRATRGATKAASPGVRCVVGDYDDVGRRFPMPRGVCLVMTHDHALDQRVDRVGAQARLRVRRRRRQPREGRAHARSASRRRASRRRPRARPHADRRRHRRAPARRDRRRDRRRDGRVETVALKIAVTLSPFGASTSWRSR